MPAGRSVEAYWRAGRGSRRRRASDRGRRGPPQPADVRRGPTACRRSGQAAVQRHLNRGDRRAGGGRLPERASSRRRHVRWEDFGPR